MPAVAFPHLAPGEKINNQQLCDIFGCSPQGGMRKSNSTNTLVLISNHIKSIYDDRWDGNTLHYTGMGTTGAQSLNFAQNKTLAQSETNGISIYLFEVFKDKEYTYQGEVLLVDPPYTESQPGHDGSSRPVYIFPLQLKSTQRVASATDRQHVREVKQRKAARLSMAELSIRAEQSHSKRIPNTSKTTATVYERDEWVSEYAKRLADGHCQLCGNPAPFTNKKGLPYLETHHIEWLSNGGSDTPENTVALCPNCHRKMHVLNDPKDVAFLEAQVTHLLSKE
ncbi:HNH endonuclease [Celerinatantimonas sp. MCCC 1A17872]|uniref:HNH endonuclease n=1 Tax=Celerinatantimonas sp. MCCC 1A17872 TaxID=3177514 RepID=UPI0038BE542F